MRLNKIKLAGFKSFVDPTNIPFPGDMTAIVGPNGCGKSNVIDAVRWVLGESSAKNLRGDAMTDVIFNGSSARKPVGQCSVELVFDNSSGRIGGEFANYNELSVKRLVTRDAQSFYYLNGTKCRRRDVTDIFLGTGLGPRSYAIIEQGMISRLIESKPQELRVFIEEAAGVSKYKERRKDTLNRIKHTQENLERLADVRAELGTQLDKLQRQASAARRYKQLKAEQRETQSSLFALRWLKQSHLIDASEAAIQSLNLELDKFKAEQQGGQTALTTMQTQMDDWQLQLNTLTEQKFALSNHITRLEQDAKYAKVRREELQQECDRAQQQLSIYQNAINEWQDKLTMATQRLAQMQPALEKSTEQLDTVDVQLDEVKAQLADHNATHRDTELSVIQLKNTLANKHSRLQTLLANQMQHERALNDAKERVNETNQALSQYYHHVAVLTEDIATVESDISSLQDALSHKQAQSVEYKQAQSTLFETQRAKQSELVTLQAKLKVLIETREQASATLPIQLRSICQRLPDVLSISEAGQIYFDQWLAHYDQVWYANLTCAELTDVIESAQDIFQRIRGHVFICSDSIGERLPEQTQLVTLADHVTAANNVPVALTRVALTPSKHTNADFARWQLTPTGLLQADGILYAPRPGEQQSDFVRQQIIDELQASMAHSESDLHDINHQLHTAECSLQDAITTLDELRLTHQTKKEELQRFQLQLNQQHFLIEQQREQGTVAKQKLEALDQQMEVEAQELEFLNEEIAIDEEQLDALTHTQDDTAHIKQSLEQNLELLSQERQQLQQQLHQQQLSLQQIENDQRLAQSSVTDKQIQIEEAASQAEFYREELLAIDEPSDNHDEQLQTLLEEQSTVEEKIVDVQQLMSQLDAKMKLLEQGAQGYQTKCDQINAQIQAEKLALEGHNVRAASIIEQMQRQQISLKEVLPTLDEESDEMQVEEHLTLISSKIQRLGAVNLAAVEEYEVQSERKQHLDSQHEDLASALDTLEHAMKKIDNETKSRFKSTFEQVNGDLKLLFPKVFGGGSAYLELTGDDMLETGVTIMARPPGKKNSTIHLLSGGEKALTALSLVFAIFRLNPAPFCLLDEVDAPLDDANVGRFCKLVSEMSKTVQFIYISHNKIAMEMATHLTGVTMAEPGVSRMVAVDIDEAVAITQNA